MLGTKKIFIAELLLEHHLITKEQFDIAIEKQKKSNKKLGQLLIELGFVDEDKLLELLSKQLNIPYINLVKYDVDKDVAKLLPEFYSRHYKAIVLKKTKEACLVGLVDPQDLIAHDEIERILKTRISVAIIREDQLLSKLAAVFSQVNEISQFAETLYDEIKAEDIHFIDNKKLLSGNDVPVDNLMRSIFENAVELNASDIHVEPDENVLRIRLRVDGILNEQIIKEKSIINPLIQRIKLIADLNIAESRLPQDGRFSMEIKQTRYDIRVSTIPVQFGESVVMRLLNQSAGRLQLDEITMPPSMLLEYKHMIASSYGLILIVGPTGGGKTTTLYATLNHLNRAEDKIITIEDPVEYRLPRINQIQVNAKIDLTFAKVLRSVLRQDPDIIMVGEMRDQETVQMALRAAMTGHLVLATLHTNDTISAIDRLLDMGAEPYLIASIVRGVVAQRLARKTCKSCLITDELSLDERTWLTAVSEQRYAQATFKKGQGCEVCHQTGYKGRIGIFELLTLKDNLITAIRNNSLEAFHREAEVQRAFQSLLFSGLDLAAQGLTTISEVMKMAGDLNA